MEEAINEFVINNFGLSVFIMVLILVAVSSLSIWFYKIHEKVNSIDKLPCEKHMDMITRHERSMTKVETSISFLIKEIESLARMLNNNKGFTKTMSPLSITEEGYKMINRLGLDKMFSRNWRRIDDLITLDCEEKTAYDINNFCIEQAVVFPEKFLEDDDIDKLKEDAYKNGLDLSAYMKVVAVMSRDKYFKEHGIDIQG